MPHISMGAQTDLCAQKQAYHLAIFAFLWRFIAETGASNAKPNVVKGAFAVIIQDIFKFPEETS